MNTISDVVNVDSVHAASSHLSRGDGYYVKVFLIKLLVVGWRTSAHNTRMKKGNGADSG